MLDLFDLAPSPEPRCDDCGVPLSATDAKYAPYCRICLDRLHADRQAMDDESAARRHLDHPELSLEALADHQAEFYRSWNNAAGNVLAKAMERIGEKRRTVDRLLTKYDGFSEAMATARSAKPEGIWIGIPDQTPLTLDEIETEHDARQYDPNECGDWTQPGQHYDGPLD